METKTTATKTTVTKAAYDQICDQLKTCRELIEEHRRLIHHQHQQIGELKGQEKELRNSTQKIVDNNENLQAQIRDHIICNARLEGYILRFWDEMNVPSGERNIAGLFSQQSSINKATDWPQHSAGSGPSRERLAPNQY